MNYTSESFETIKNWLRNHLTEEKYSHSLGTMECAGELAELFGLNIEKAKIAGLLHDCAKNIKNEVMLEMVKNNCIDVYNNELITPKILHAPLSAFIAKNEFGVEDVEILSAIRFHTIAKENMTSFEEIIYISDKIEPNTREKELRNKVIKLLKENNGLKKAMYFLIGRTIEYLRKKNFTVNTSALNLHKYYEGFL